MSEQAAPLPHVCAQRRTLAGAIFDVDGVLVLRNLLGWTVDTTGGNGNNFYANPNGGPRRSAVWRYQPIRAAEATSPCQTKSAQAVRKSCKISP
jgi:hypothetical protein